MKRYFVDGVEITEAEANEIKAKNDEYFKNAENGNFAELLNIKFIVIIDA